MRNPKLSDSISGTMIALQRGQVEVTREVDMDLTGKIAVVTGASGGIGTGDGDRTHDNLLGNPGGCLHA